MVPQVADIEERFLTGVDHEDRVPDSMAKRKDRMDSRGDFVTVFDEVQPVLFGRSFLLAVSIKVSSSFGLLSSVQKSKFACVM
jgi:hypothetical protein